MSFKCILSSFYRIQRKKYSIFFSCLKGHGNVADFLGFLHKLYIYLIYSVRNHENISSRGDTPDHFNKLHKLDHHRSLTLPFEPFRFWLRIPGDICNRKTPRPLVKSESLRLSYSASHRFPDSASRGVADSTTRRVRESLTFRLGESGSWLLNF
jgi:hypothetical protein